MAMEQPSRACPELVERGRPIVAQHAGWVSSFYISGAANWPAEDILPYLSTNSLSCASPGLQSGEAGVQTRENVPVYKLRALALVAGHPIPSPETPMTRQTAPVSRSSPL